MTKQPSIDPTYLADLDAFYDLQDNDECPNCGGEGVVSDCIDGMCLDPESGCELCERKCDWCGGKG
jgi:hypothetical protein